MAGAIAWVSRSTVTDLGGTSIRWPYAVMRGTAQLLLGDPVIEMPGPLRDFAVTLSDGRRVVGHDRDGEWSIYVYAGDGDRRLLGYGIARTRLDALEHAGLSGEDAGEVLGRAGI